MKKTPPIGKENRSLISKSKNKKSGSSKVNNSKAVYNQKSDKQKSGKLELVDLKKKL
jgi:hypothetical protein